jgi:hypothetical protein
MKPVKNDRDLLNGVLDLVDGLSAKFKFHVGI